jgi:hypothetical protein
MRWLASCGLALALLHTSAAQAEEPERDGEKKRSSEKIVERVSRGAIHESLDVLDEPESRARIGSILSSPELRKALRELTASMVSGVFDGIRGARIDRRITPGAARMTRSVVDTALTEALADEHIDKVEEIAERTTRAMIRGVAKGLEEDLGPALAITLERDLGPALAITVERDLGPAAAVTLSRDILPAVGLGLDTPEVKTAVANLSRSVATEAIGGAGDAMDAQAQQRNAEGTEGGLSLFGARIARGAAIAMFVAAALGILLVVLTIMIVRGARRQRQQAAQASRREAALLHLVESIEGDHPELTADMRRLLRDQLVTRE